MILPTVKQKQKHTCSQMVFSTFWWSSFSQFIRLTFIFPLLYSALDAFGGGGGGGATVKPYNTEHKYLKY